MKEWIDLSLRLIGFAVVVSAMIISIRLIFDKYIRGTFCKHKYTVQGRLKMRKENILFLKCNKCGKEKDIEIYDDKLTIELKREVEKDGDTNGLLYTGQNGRI